MTPAITIPPAPRPVFNPIGVNGALRRAAGNGAVRRRAAEHLGRSAEEAVARHMEAQGYAVLARRLRTGAGEIDIVVADDARLLFIEVKARGSLAAAADAISSRQQARLLEAASVALMRHEAWARPQTRFDVALVAPGAVPALDIEILEDAIRYC